MRDDAQNVSYGPWSDRTLRRSSAGQTGARVLEQPCFRFVGVRGELFVFHSATHPHPQRPSYLSQRQKQAANECGTLPPPLVVSTLELPWRVEDGGLEGKGHVVLTPTPPCLVFSVWNRDGTW